MSDNVNSEHEEVETEKTPVENTLADNKIKPKKTATAEETALNVDGLSVSLEKIVFESLYERNSRTIGLIQIRLIELGYMTAGSDKRGWFSVGTKDALDAFMADKKLDGDYSDVKVLEKLFAGTKVDILP